MSKTTDKLLEEIEAEKAEVTTDKEELNPEQALLDAFSDEEPEAKEEDKEEDPPETMEEENLSDDDPPDDEEPDSKDDKADSTSEPPLSLLDQYDEEPVSNEPSYLDQLKGQLDQLESKVNKGFMADLPVIKDEKGLSIYEMDNSAFNDYITQLNDNGDMELASRAAYSRNKAAEKAHEYHQNVNHLNQFKEYYSYQKEQAEQIPEWNSVAKKWDDQFEGFSEKHGEKIAQYLSPMLEKYNAQGELNPSFDAKLYEAVKSNDGKHRAVVKALKALGLAKELRPSENKVSEKPTAPDVSAGRKRVKNTPKPDTAASKVEKYAKASSKEFGKLSQSEKDELLQASLTM